MLMLMVSAGGHGQCTWVVSGTLGGSRWYSYLLSRYNSKYWYVGGNGDLSGGDLR